MNIAFYKLHVAGDDRVLVDAAPGSPAPDGLRLSAALLKRRRGAGAAGLVVLERTERALWLRPYSRRGEPCAAGPVDALCAARYLFDSGRVPGDSVELETAEGRLLVDAIDSSTFALTLHPPLARSGEEFRPERAARAARRVEAGGRALDIVPLKAGGRSFAVLFPGDSVAAPSGARRPRIGTVSGDLAVVEARVASRSRLRVRTRGADVCSAACAATAAAAAFGLCDRETTVAFGKRESDTPLREAVFVKWLDDGRLYVAARPEYCYSGEYWLPDPEAAS